MTATHPGLDPGLHAGPDPGMTPEAPRTYLPRLGMTEEDEPDAPVRTGMTQEDVLSLLSSAGAAIGVGLTLSLVLHIVTWAWTPVVIFVWFVVIYVAVSYLSQPAQTVLDRCWTVILWAGALMVVATLALVIGYVLVHGWGLFGAILAPSGHESLLGRLHFFTRDMSGVTPLAGLNQGGIYFAIVGTLIQIGIALAITLPLGLTTAVFLSEIGGRFARIVRTVTEAMTALPSVVAGLFIYAFVIQDITHRNVGFAASLALTILMLPIMIRSSDVVLRLVPANLREAGLALGAGQWSTVWHVVLPTVRSGLTTAVILATAHGIGETAPVLLTSGVTTFTNYNPFANSMTSLPLAALEYVEQPYPVMKERGFATAAVLLVLVLVLFAAARLLAGNDTGQVSGRQSRRLARRSRRTAVSVARSQARYVARRMPARVPVARYVPPPGAAGPGRPGFTTTAKDVTA